MYRTAISRILFTGIFFTLLASTLSLEAAFSRQPDDQQTQSMDNVMGRHYRTSFDYNAYSGGDSDTLYLYANSPPPPTFYNSPTVYTTYYAVPPPAYYFITDQYGMMTWGQINR